MRSHLPLPAVRLAGVTAHRQAAALACLLLAACNPWSTTPAPRLTLAENGKYQTLLDMEGRPLRRAYDEDGDRRADAINFYRQGRLERAEVDTDRDGIVDRWEVYSEDGKIVRVGRATRQPGRPDEWSYPDGLGGISRRELDDDGDGHIDRAEVYVEGRVVAEEFDTDRDGTLDRRLVRRLDGTLERVEARRPGEPWLSIR
jgi:hypothetical protein